MFSYLSDEARRCLGLPDSPVIHLAITKLADSLMPLADGTQLSPEKVRIAALRTASSSALKELPFECAVFEFLTLLELPADKAVSDEAYQTTRTDWLGAALAEIRAAGNDTGPDARRMATQYGWNSQPAKQPQESENWRSTARRVVPSVRDEHGRTWIVPQDTAGMKELLNEYGRRHGRPSRAVKAAFSRHHGQLNTLRMLVVRGAEGECINLAARALALGPLPPMRRMVPAAPEGANRPADLQQRLWAMDDEFDRRIVEDLCREADELRTRGYID